MARYDYGSGSRERHPYSPWYPGAFWASPLSGWGGWEGMNSWGWPLFTPGVYRGYAPYFPPPLRRPEESPTYGRGGDRAVRRYARSHGYPPGYAIPPRSIRPAHARPRYDRGYGG